MDGPGRANTFPGIPHVANETTRLRRRQGTKFPMSVLIYHANAFCGPTARGNPAAVCLLKKPAAAEWMQAVAQQMNLSQTGFIIRREPDQFDLRFFSPRKEMSLCGHVTFCAAHAVWSEMLCTKNTPITFHTASGSLSVRNNDSFVEIALPMNPCQETSTPEWLSQAIPLRPVRVLAGVNKYLVEVATAQEVEEVQPDFAVLRDRADRGVIVTAASADPSYDIVSRYFAGYVGIDEDPATGAAHCCLVPYWKEKLRKNRIRAHQASPRGGVMEGRIEADRVLLAGKARTVLRGELLI